MNKHKKHSYRALIFVLFLLAIAATMGFVIFSDHDRQIAKYASYIQAEENGLSIQQVHQKLSFTARYIPIEYQALKDQATQLDDYEGHLYFRLNLRPLNQQKGLQSLLADKYPTEVEKKWQDFLLSTQKKFTLTYGSTIFPCVIQHAIPPAIKGHGVETLLVFKAEGFTKDQFFDQTLTLNYQDDIWTQDHLAFTFTPDHLNAIPLPTF